LIELGGGYRESDLEAYFAKLGLPKPNVTSVSVGGAKNEPGRGGGDAQVTLDIEVAGAVASGARIVVYFAPNTNQGFLDAITQAVHDKLNNPSVISISWGSPENFWTATTLRSIDAALREAALLGISVVVAAGDGGVTDRATDQKPHVDFPASSPYALAVGGTRIAVAGNVITSEVVWNSGGGATGGGVSDVFPLPDWQRQANVPPRAGGGAGRGLPDVAANADPISGYRVIVEGRDIVIGGTAAAAPLWAGLLALINQGVGRNVGYINPTLYEKVGPAGILRSVTTGDNSIDGVKGYAAGPGWNAAAGWGSPDGRKLLAALRQP
jgi:kumamolisin